MLSIFGSSSPVELLLPLARIDEVTREPIVVFRMMRIASCELTGPSVYLSAAKIARRHPWLVAIGFHRLTMTIPSAHKKSAPGRTRTYDKAVNSRLLYQLSYRSVLEEFQFQIGKCIPLVFWPQGLKIRAKTPFSPDCQTLSPTKSSPITTRDTRFYRGVNSPPPGNSA